MVDQPARKGGKDNGAVRGRLPPQALEDEKALLGVLLLYPNDWDKVTGLLVADDFHDGKHKLIYDAMAVMFKAHQAVDTTTVANRLRVDGLFESAGGAAYLMQVQSEAGARSHLQQYAWNVLDAAQARRMIWVGSQITDLGFERSEGGFEQAKQLLHDATSSMLRSGLIVSTPLLSDLLDANPNWQKADWIIPGMLARRHRLVIAARGGRGKALDALTPIPTPDGYRPVGELRVGDLVFGRDGLPVRIVGVSGLLHDRSCSEVRFRTGATLVADDQHQWTIDRAVRKARRVCMKVTTGELRPGDRVPIGGPTATRSVCLMLDPYTLGIWLGDGSCHTSHVTLNDRDSDAITARIRSAGIETRKVLAQRSCHRWHLVPEREPLNVILRRLGILDRKAIPEEYLTAGTAQRMELLRGIIDTDGHVLGSGDGRVEIVTTSYELGIGIERLVASLGYKASRREGLATLDGRTIGPKWRITFTPTDLGHGLPAVTPFRLERMGARAGDLAQTRWVHVKAVTPAASRPVCCIQVEAADGLYQAGLLHTVTHNSTMIRQTVCFLAAGFHPFLGDSLNLRRAPVRSSLVIDLENDQQAWMIETRAMMEFLRARGGVWPLPIALHALGGVSYDPVQNRSDRLDLFARLRETTPDNLVIGPLYKLDQKSGAEWHQTAGRIQDLLDDIRGTFNCSIMVEAHVGSSGGAVRGAKDWEFWPEMVKRFAFFPGDRTRLKVEDVRTPRFRQLYDWWPTELAKHTNTMPQRAVWPDGYWPADGGGPKWDRNPDDQMAGIVASLLPTATDDF